MRTSKWIVVALSIAVLTTGFATSAFAADAVEVPYLEQWRTSPHAKKDSEAFRHWDKEGAVPEACAACHSHGGYLDFLGADGSQPRKMDKPHATDTVIGCTTCHNDETLAMTEVTFPSGAVIQNAGRSMRCMVCHQGRQSGPGVHKGLAGLELDQVSDKVSFQNIHYRAAAATAYGTLVKGGYEYAGQSYAGEYKHVEGFQTCTECHDAHTTKVKEDTCAVCHRSAKGGALDRIRMAKIDFDGNGNADEGLAVEINTLHSMLYAQIQAYAAKTAGAAIAYDAHAYPYFFADTNGNGQADADEAVRANGYKSWTPRLAMAAYNYQFVAKDPGGFAHNGKYMVQLLQDSIQDLGGDVGKMSRP